jgi:hypothetical protein
MFTLLVSLTALLVAGVAAFFSVKGIGMLFAGAMIEAMVMAGSLEIGKLVVTSFIYRYYNQIPKVLKLYLIIAVITLMGITSLGIYGFLSGAYQKSASEYGIFTQQVSLLEKQKEYVSKDLKTVDDRIQALNDARKLQEDSLNKASSTNTGNKEVSSSQLSQSRRIQENTLKLIADSSKEVSVQQKRQEELLNKIKDFDMKVMELKETSKHNKDIVTFQFIADAIGWELNRVVQWFIVIIIIVFDPLAVGLVLAYNIIVCGKMVKEEPIKESPKVNKIESPEPPPVVLEDKPVSTPIHKEKLVKFFSPEGLKNVKLPQTESIVDETAIKEYGESELKKTDINEFDKMINKIEASIDNTKGSQETYEEIQRKLEEKRGLPTYNVAVHTNYPNK